MKNKKINITNLAKKLNLSVSSVSRALNGHKNISYMLTIMFEVQFLAPLSWPEEINIIKTP